ncbi:MAG: PaaI family thioesterase [Desulfovibrionaceae bacterium]|nr:PaaI family thioesterase [Desulfovibrionaceae bacterium]
MVSLEKVSRHFAEHDHFGTMLGISITELDDAHCVAEMELKACHRNGMNAAHGGVLFTLADLAFAAICNRNGDACVGMQVSISYLRACMIGPVRAVARPVREGRKICSYDIRIFDGEGREVAVAMSMGCKIDRRLPGFDEEDA